MGDHGVAVVLENQIPAPGSGGSNNAWVILLTRKLANHSFLTVCLWRVTERPYGRQYIEYSPIRWRVRVKQKF
jgi:hypothetical protein